LGLQIRSSLPVGPESLRRGFRLQYLSSLQISHPSLMTSILRPPASGYRHTTLTAPATSEYRITIFGFDYCNLKSYMFYSIGKLRRRMKTRGTEIPTCIPKRLLHFYSHLTLSGTGGEISTIGYGNGRTKHLYRNTRQLDSPYNFSN